MRRISRLDRPIGLLQPRTSSILPFSCLACNRHAPSFSTSSWRKEKAPLTERLRQRIWGTDKPPGREDPYGDESYFDQTKKKKKRAVVKSEEDTAKIPAEDTDKLPGATDPEIRKRERALRPSNNGIRRSSKKMSLKGNKEMEAYNNLPLLRMPKVPGARKFRTFDEARIWLKRSTYTPEELPKYYEPAQTAQGLTELDSESPLLGAYWDAFHPVPGFAPKEKETNSDVITAALHRAIVEVFAVKQIGKELADVEMASPKDIDLTDDVQITPSESGVTLQLGSGTTLEQIAMSFSKGYVVEENLTESEKDVAADRSRVDPLKEKKETVEVKTYEQVIASWDPSWLQISLADPDVKFAVLKRTMQLTGIRLSDSVIQSSNTAETLLKHFITVPPPTKLAEALADKRELLNLPNVSVYPRRLVPSDKETSVGRWKVIEKELTERGLPVFGRG